MPIDARRRALVLAYKCGPALSHAELVGRSSTEFGGDNGDSEYLGLCVDNRRCVIPLRSLS